VRALVKHLILLEGPARRMIFVARKIFRLAGETIFLARGRKVLARGKIPLAYFFFRPAYFFFRPAYFFFRPAYFFFRPAYFFFPLPKLRENWQGETMSGQPKHKQKPRSGFSSGRGFYPSQPFISLWPVRYRGCV